MGIASTVGTFAIGTSASVAFPAALASTVATSALATTCTTAGISGAVSASGWTEDGARVLIRNSDKIIIRNNYSRRLVLFSAPLFRQATCLSSRALQHACRATPTRPHTDSPRVHPQTPPAPSPPPLSPDRRLFRRRPVRRNPLFY